MSAGRDPMFVEAMGQALGFYSAELQSHAATMVSFAIGLFALLSIRIAGPLGIVLFTVGGTVLPMLIVYSFLRLLVYGQLSKAILIGDDRLVDLYSSDYRKQKLWDPLFPLTQVSHYTNMHFLEHWYKQKHLRILKGCYLLNVHAQPRMLPLIFIGMVSFAVSLAFALYG